MKIKVLIGCGLLILLLLYSVVSIYPDWWKLPSQPVEYWPHIDAVIDGHAPHCRGIVILGLDQPVQQLAQGFKDSCRSKWVKGFLVL